MHEITYSFSEEYSGQNKLKVITIDTAAKTVAEMMDIYNLSNDQRLQISDILADHNDEFWSQLLFGIGSSNGSYALVQVAWEQIGNAGEQPYWSWYGYESRVEWCACFVSWCALQCGYIDKGVLPLTVGGSSPVLRGLKFLFAPVYYEWG